LKDNRALRAWGSLCGLLYVVLFVIGSILLFSGPNGENDSQAKYAAYYNQSGHRDRFNIGWILVGLGLFFLIWFITALRETVREIYRDRADGDGMLGLLVTSGGTIYVAVAMVAIGLADGVKTMSDDTYHHQVYSGIIHAANDASYIIHVTGTAGLAAMISAFSIAILNRGVLPRWLGWFGILAAVAALASLIFFTMIVWLAWIAVTSLIVFSRSRKIPPVPTNTALQS
jgi:hypothetical protein